MAPVLNCPINSFKNIIPYNGSRCLHLILMLSCSLTPVESCRLCRQNIPVLNNMKAEVKCISDLYYREKGWNFMTWERSLKFTVIPISGSMAVWQISPMVPGYGVLDFTNENQWLVSSSTQNFIHAYGWCVHWNLHPQDCRIRTEVYRAWYIILCGTRCRWISPVRLVHVPDTRLYLTWQDQQLTCYDQSCNTSPLIQPPPSHVFFSWVWIWTYINCD